MQLSILPILALASTTCAAGAHVDIFKDGHCQDLLMNVHVYGDTCWTASPQGFFSMRVTEAHGLFFWSRVTAYIENNCGRAYGARGFDAHRHDCLGPFDYGAANAIGLFI